MMSPNGEIAWTVHEDGIARTPEGIRVDFLKRVAEELELEQKWVQGRGYMHRKNDKCSACVMGVMCWVANDMGAGMNVVIGVPFIDSLGHEVREVYYEGCSSMPPQIFYDFTGMKEYVGGYNTEEQRVYDDEGILTEYGKHMDQFTANWFVNFNDTEHPRNHMSFKQFAQHIRNVMLRGAW